MTTQQVDTVGPGRGGRMSRQRKRDRLKARLGEMLLKTELREQKGSVSSRASDGFGGGWEADVASPVAAAGGTSG